MRTRTWRNSSIAWGMVLAWHGLLVWTLLRSPGIDHAHNDGRALQVVWITAPVPAAIAGVQSPTVARLHSQRRDKRAPIDTARRAPAALQSADPQPLSATFLEQAHALVQQQASIDFGSRDPLASRPTQLPGAGAGRFRMRPQRSARDLVAAVGGYLFAPKGYESDPCPRNRENIGNMMAGGDSAALQQELEFERRHCRP